MRFTPHCLVGWDVILLMYMHQTKLLKKAMTMLDNDKQAKKIERENTLAERVPELQLSSLSLQDLQVRSSGKHQVLPCCGSEEIYL